MTNIYKNKLKQELSIYCPDFTDNELQESTNNLIDLFKLGITIIEEIQSEENTNNNIQNTSLPSGKEVND